MYLPLNLEIDVAKNEQLQEAIDLTIRHIMPAIVVAPDLVPLATIMRGVRRGNFKIISMIDWPKGDQYGKDKFRGVPIEALNSDGFEIIISPRDPMSIVSEIKYLTTFLREQFHPLFEIRYVLEMQQGRSEEQISAMLGAFKQIPMPAMARTTHLNKIAAQISLEGQIIEIRKSCAVPVKLSGNIDFKVYKDLEKLKPERFGVSLQQAQAIIKDALSIGRTPRPVTS